MRGAARIAGRGPQWNRHGEFTRDQRVTLSYSVGRCTREMGIRMALGANRADVLRLVLGDTLRIAVPGAAAGLIAVYELTSLLEKLLYRVSPADPATIVLVPAALVAAALVASAIPARRATRVNPVAALRQE